MSQTKRHSETDGTPDKNAALPSSTDDGPQRENNHNQANAPDSTQLQSEAYDQDLLERARTQWQFGDWKSLAKLQPENIENHPERVKLALLTAAGHLQLKHFNKARAFIKLAKQWGSDKRLISRILISGVYNTLGKAAAIARKDERALEHFTKAVQDISGDIQLNSQARRVHEITSLGFLNQASELVEKEVNLLSEKPYTNKFKQQVSVLRTELDLLHQELSLAQQRQQLTKKRTSIPSESKTQSYSSNLDSLKNKTVSQLGQDIWVLEKLNYKKGGFFVEFGATDGVLLSNSFLLEKEFEWQGICAEPNPKLFAQLQKNRSCICKNTCIAGTDNEEREFILADAYGSLASYEDCDQHKQKRQAYRETGEVIKLRTVSLNSFLRDCEAPREIDYLSIDTEGSELEILQEFDFNYWQVKLLTVEHNFQAEPRQKIRELLARYGYQVQEAQWDDWFWRPDLVDSLIKKPKIILSAGMPRSGSTWLFNAARLLLQSNNKVVAKWIDDFEEDDFVSANILIIKMHEFDLSWVNKADLIIYSYRDIRDAIASAERKFGKKPSMEQARGLIDMDYEWKQVADFIFKYESLSSEEENILINLSNKLGVELSLNKIRRISAELNRISYNDSGIKNNKYHYTNLMHPNHITSGGYGTWVNQIDNNLINNIEINFKHWFDEHNYKVSI